MPPADLMCVRYFLPKAEKDDLRSAFQVTFCTQNVITCAIISRFLRNHDIITSQVRILYASGGIDAHAKFSAKGRNAYAQLYHAFLRNHDIISRINM